jgi:diguanylate cyclase (GGDEF)-like protein/PAS domain S-box-containing protein
VLFRSLTSVRFVPLFVVAYLLPLHTAGRATIEAVSSIVHVGPVCIVVGEMMAWVSHQLRAAQAAFLERRGEERFRSLVQNASDVLLVLDGAGVIRYGSPALQRVLGYRVEDRIGRSALENVHPDEVGWVASVLKEVLESPGAEKTIELRVRDAHGDIHVMEATGKNLLRDPNVEGLLVTLRDVTERKALEEQLKHQAFHDPLTGLANRVLFIDRVEHALARSARTPHALAVLFLDIDDFKTVNDSLGHDAGDQLLVVVAQRLRSALREGDTAARLGGDEFAILLEDADEEAPTRVAERILAALRQPATVQHRELSTRASIGVALRASPKQTAEELLRNADIAMYTAKAKGKARFEVFEPGMQEAAINRLELRGDLEAALEQSQFTLAYQPIVSLRTGDLYGFEALVRWNHPRRGVLLPAEFIPLAEETGVISQLGRWVLEEATRQAGRWQSDYPGARSLGVAVNVSARQFDEPELVSWVAEALRSSRLPPHLLTLEITESVLVQDTEAAIATLRELKGLGVRLAIDDFGTGYSSLSYLHRFPIDTLKIDRSFVTTVGRRREEAALVRSIINLSQTLEIETVAEGVEEATQLGRLKALGADLAQGYYFAKPLAPDEVPALLTTAGVAERKPA